MIRTRKTKMATSTGMFSALGQRGALQIMDSIVKGDGRLTPLPRRGAVRSAGAVLRRRMLHDLINTGLVRKEEGNKYSLTEWGMRLHADAIDIERWALLKENEGKEKGEVGAGVRGDE